MGTQSAEVQLVGLSVDIYRLLLTFYPSRFRREYGTDMLQVFRDLSIRAHGRSGASGMLSLWATTLFDLMRSIVEEQFQREILQMMRNTMIRLSGWTLVVGGLASTAGSIALILGDMMGLAVFQLGGTLEGIMLTAFFLGPIGVAVGMLGLRARYGDAVGGLGKAALAVGAFGGLMVLIGIFQQMDAVGFNAEDFTVFVIGLVLIFACLVLFGILALRRKPLPRWNGLPILAGLPILVIELLAVLSPSLGISNGTLPLPWVWVAGMAAMGVSLAMLGYMVQSDLSEEISAEPVNA